MEEHRLKPMKEGYDENLFNQLYRDTSGLRKALAYQIDSRRFGVDYNEILSWFDVKFIFAFNKYYGEMSNDMLRGHIINSLKTFKYRIMKEAYLKKNEQYQNRLSIDDTEVFENLISQKETGEEEAQNKLLSEALTYLKTSISDDAYFILELQLDPPQYILNKLEDLDNPKVSSIPNEILADYLGLIPNTKVISYIKDLKREIKFGIESARVYFKSQKLNLTF